MSDDRPYRENYTPAKCCAPAPPDQIVGYYSYDNVLKVHRADCANLAKADPERLVELDWDDVLEQRGEFAPDEDFDLLDATDFAVLAHHETYGVDYSLVVARKLNMSKSDAFACHQRLRDFGLLERVEPLIIRYRKGIVDNKWIKHRNHTYYELTAKGRGYLTYYRLKCRSDGNL